ncbi:MAG: hypothetical protein KDC98_26270 [Planctomycetes bacterium]|nr:hypothetical protein [Planctomycetota bacterium]
MQYPTHRLAMTALATAVLCLPGCSKGKGGDSPGLSNQANRLGLKATNPREDGGLTQLRLGAFALPSQFDWRAKLPPIGDQGRQGSCVGWSTAYYTKTAFEAMVEGWSTTDANHQFSPAWVYNQINGGEDNGSLPSDAFQLMVDRGAATLATMPYRDSDFTQQPGAAAIGEAAGFKNTDSSEHGVFDFAAITSYLANTGPLVLGIQVYSNFYQAGTDYTSVTGELQGGHAITCAGYDLNRNGGSLLLANSWATTWGDAGFTWISRDALRQIFIGAWTMTDGPNTGGGGSGIPMPTGFSGTASNNVVELTWNRVSQAARYHIERRDTSATWRGVGDVAGADNTFVDIGVQANQSYDYRIAAVDANDASSGYATTTVSTAPGGSVQDLNLTATNAGSNNAFPDKIVLAWQRHSTPGLFYFVLRSEGESGFATGNYDIIAGAVDIDGYQDLVLPESIYHYVVLAMDGTLTVQGQSEIVRGTTSGMAGGFDLWINNASGSLTVTRGTTSNATMDVGNWSAQASPSQRLRMGMEYYFWNSDLWGILEFADQQFGNVPILDVATNQAIGSYSGVRYGVQPRVPVYLVTDPRIAAHWWYFYVEPLDGSNGLLRDVYPLDNEFYTFQQLTIR